MAQLRNWQMRVMGEVVVMADSLLLCVKRIEEMEGI